MPVSNKGGGLSKKHRRRIKVLSPYVGEVAKRMKLAGWEVIVSLQVAPDDVNARIQPVFGQKKAHLEIGKSFWLKSREDQRQIIVHELEHLHYASVTNAVLNHLEGLVRTFFEQEMEYGINVSADLIAPSMPLPPKIGNYD